MFKIIYTTSQISKIFGIHPNTVRLYENLSFISKPERKPNGYRVFTDLHLDQLKLLRKALKIEVLQSDLRKMALEIIKLTAACEFDNAIIVCKNYISCVEMEINNANDAIGIVKGLLSEEQDCRICMLKRSEVAQKLRISIDTLRNWEMNGLLSIKRKENGYRTYSTDDIKIIKIIKCLRCANYSLSSILRMLSELSKNKNVNVYEILNTPKENEEIISVCDQLIISLNKAKENGYEITNILYEMKKKYSNPPL